MSGVDGINDRVGNETWHLRQLWQFAKNRGYSVKLEDDRIWLTPSGQGSAASGRSFPDTRAGIQAARAWLTEPVKPVKLDALQSEVERGTVSRRVVDGAASGAGRVIGWIVGFVVASAVVGGVVSWWNDNHWSSAGENAFLSSCEAQPGASVSYCGCALGQVEQHYGPKQAGEILTSNPSVVNAIAGYCVGQ